MLSTVKKIGPVLELFTPQHPEWRLTDLSRALEMPKSSAHSLVTTLVEVGLLSIDRSGGYRLGWNLLTLAEQMRASLDFRRHAVDPMRELSQTLRETVLLAALDRHEVVYVERVEGNHPMVRLAGVRPGARVPAYCTAVGKVLLASREPDEVRSLMEIAEWKRYTRNTIQSIDELEQALILIRAEGVAYDHSEIVPDVACVAAPIHDAWGTPIAGISVSMPAYRFPQDPTRMVAVLKGAAGTISAKIEAANDEAREDVTDDDVSGIATIS